MILNSSGRIDKVRYMRCDKTNRQEKARVENILSGGTVDYNDLTSTKVSGTVPYVGTFNLENDYLRIYVDMEKDTEKRSILLGTFFASTPQTTHLGQAKEGTAQLYSLLKLLEDDVIESPLSVAANTQVIAFCASMINACGLAVTASPSSAALTQVATFDAGKTKLEVINTLLGYAGFKSLGIDVYGNTVMHEYTDPANLTPAVEFVDGGGCAFLPSVLYEFDTFSVPNKVVAVLSNPDSTLSSTAINDSAQSIYSTVSRGRVVSYVETVSEIESQAQLDAVAKRILSNKTSAVESIELTHVYQDFKTGDAGRLVYRQSDLEFVGVCVSQSMTLEAGLPTKSRFRRFVRG